jgi:TRAP transporter TAXI family solute receptor
MSGAVGVFRRLLPVGLALVASAAPGTAQTTASIGTNPPGSVFYAVGSGLAKVATDAATVRLSVQPYAGSSTFLPLINSGELEFGVNTAMDAALAHRGPGFKAGGRNPFPHTPNLRLVMLGPTLTSAPLVRKDSPIRTVHDMRGKRVTGEYPAQLTAWYGFFGALAGAGLSWTDVQVVPVPGVTEGVDALVQRRADVTLFALNGAKVREADAAVGVRHISLDCSAEGEQRLRSAVLGYYVRRVKRGEAVAVVEDLCVLANDIHITTGKDVADVVVEAALRSVWERVEQLAPLHPAFRDWTRERLAHTDATIPYHPAAVRFYRERGVWTPALAETQQRLLAGNPQ